ncbi:MAG: tripartite tricarboxylate transporter TctB family protein [Roseicyclus sp.]|jgi:hypothetical protein
MQTQDQARTSIVHRATSGAVLLFIGLGMLAIGWDYPIGRLTQMGPGFIPRAIAVMICVIAVAIIIVDIADAGMDKAGGIQWRGLIFVSAAMLIFAVLVDLAGLVPAMFLAVVVSMLADKAASPATILLYAVLATGAGWLLFLVTLELPIPAFWR